MAAHATQDFGFVEDAQAYGLASAFEIDGVASEVAVHNTVAHAQAATVGANADDAPGGGAALRYLRCDQKSTLSLAFGACNMFPTPATFTHCTFDYAAEARALAIGTSDLGLAVASLALVTTLKFIFEDQDAVAERPELEVAEFILVWLIQLYIRFSLSLRFKSSIVGFELAGVVIEVVGMLEDVGKL